MRAIAIRPAATWAGEAADRVVLDYDDRHRRRIAMTGDNGMTFLLDLPAPTELRGGDALNMRDQVLARMRSKDHLPRLEANAAEAFRRHTISVAEQAAAAFPGLWVLRTDRLFYHDDGSVRYAEGRAFYYADDDHLSDRGAEVARPLLQAAIAEAHASAATAMR